MGKLDAPDRDLYLVAVWSHGRPLIPEQDGLQDEAETVRFIASEVDDEPAWIIRFNAAERRCADVSDDIAQAVVNYAVERGLTLSDGVFAWCDKRGIPMPGWTVGIEAGRFVDYQPGRGGFA
jgi:hypothetical protein